MNNKKYDIVSAGELLIDMISNDFADTLEQVENFTRIQGGSPANMCMNMARLGNRTILVAAVGMDDMGQYLVNCVEKLGVDCSYIKQVETPSTLILVTRSQNVSNFEAYRGADCQISESQFPDELLQNTAFFHTTCFALSLQPARQNILNAANRAAGIGCKLSIDANYAGKIWKNQAEAQQIVAAYCANGACVKVSEVDWQRLFNTHLTDPRIAADKFLGMGAREVCVTMGSEGCLVASASENHFLPSRPVEVKDTTGAGDAFWSGYLTARLDGHSLLHSAMAGRKMAEIKLGNFGPLSAQVDRERIYEDFQ